MKVKKQILICLTGILIVILAFAALFTAGTGEEGMWWNPANLIGRNEPGKAVAENQDQPGEKGGDRVNYYELLFAVEKDPDFCPGEKNPPQPKILAAAVKEIASAPSHGGTATSKEQEMINYINQARSNAGLPPLQVNSRLTDAARAKSRDMAVNNYFSHNSPTYGSFTSLLSRYGVSYRAAAENIAWNSNGSVRSAHNSLMNSPGHRANILGSNYRQVGVGIHVRSDGRHYYTQLFVGN